MDKHEFSLFAAALRTYYPRENILPNNQSMELWYMQLQDIPYKAAEAILFAWVATNKWSPAISDIREAATKMQNGFEESDWGTGWQQVIMAIRRFGFYQVDEAMESFDPITRECVRRIGFQNICLSDNITADRANFRMLYEQIYEREKKDRQLPSSVKIMLNDLGQMMMIRENGTNDDAEGRREA